MGAELAELPNLGDERVINACLELIEAGRSVSEIIDSAKRLSTRAVPAQPEPEPIVEPASRKRARTWLVGAGMLLVVGAGAAVAEFPPHATAEDAGLALASAAIPPLSTAPPTSQIETPRRSTELEALVDRGSLLFGAGDIPGARILYERAAEAGDAHAAMYLALTYDPSFLRQARFGTTPRGDRDRAAYWYHRARDLGYVEPEPRLTMSGK